MLEKNTLPNTITVDESEINFPNNPDKPNKSTDK
jgi:hypothetical protein